MTDEMKGCETTADAADTIHVGADMVICQEAALDIAFAFAEKMQRYTADANAQGAELQPDVLKAIAKDAIAYADELRQLYEELVELEQAL